MNFPHLIGSSDEHTEEITFDCDVGNAMNLKIGLSSVNDVMPIAKFIH
jgi:hypothetical protein